MTERISVIVPTIGRPQSLERLLVSLVQQTQRVDEVVIADGSSTTETAEVAARSEWAERGLRVTRIPMQPPHAVRQREAAIAASSGELLLLLDDDVELEPDCVAELVDAMDSGPDVVAVMADFSNQPWPVPTRAWRLYLRLVHGLRDGAWQGRVIGPLLRFGYNPVPGTTVTMDWHGAGNTLIRRAAFVKVGGFSPFFLSRATINEDVDLALKLGRVGRILFCPKARMAHFHAPGGRLDSYQAAEDDLHNRYCVLRHTCRLSTARAAGLAATYLAIDSTSRLVGSVVRRRGLAAALVFLRGGTSGLWRAIRHRGASQSEGSTSQSTPAVTKVAD